MQIMQTTVVLSLEHNVMEHKEHCFSLTNANTCASSKDGNSTASVALASFTQQRMRAKHLSIVQLTPFVGINQITGDRLSKTWRASW